MQAQRDGPPHEPHARRLRHGEVSGVGCREPLSLPVLVLNRVYQPVRITSARRAILLLYTDVARALDEQGELFDFGRWRSLPVRLGVDDALPIVRGQLRVPRVVHLRRYARLNRPAIRLNRRNLMLRDDYQCQYCGARLPPHQLDIDHIQPRSRGGRDTWRNLVTACLPCNRGKGQGTPREVGMHLRRRPAAPRWSVAVQLLATAAGSYEEWEPFLAAC